MGSEPCPESWGASPHIGQDQPNQPRTRLTSRWPWKDGVWGAGTTLAQPRKKVHVVLEQALFPDPTCPALPAQAGLEEGLVPTAQIWPSMWPSVGRSVQGRSRPTLTGQSLLPRSGHLWGHLWGRLWVGVSGAGLILPSHDSPCCPDLAIYVAVCGQECSGSVLSRPHRIALAAQIWPSMGPSMGPSVGGSVRAGLILPSQDSPHMRGRQTGRPTPLALPQAVTSSLRPWPGTSQLSCSWPMESRPPA